MSKPLKVGIIGCGWIGRFHTNAYRAIPGVEVAAVADLVPGKAGQFAAVNELTSAKVFDDYRQLLELELDAVSVCTPNNSHYRNTVDALEAGKHVMLEKPMCVTVEEAIGMVQAAKSAERLLSVGFQPRYDPNAKAVKDLVQSGALGSVYYVQTGGGRRRGMPGGTFIRKDIAGIGAVADIGCYSLDLVLNALGYPKPLTVSAYTSNHFGANPVYHREADRFEVEDFGAAFIRLEGGTVIDFKMSWAMHMDTLGATAFLGTDAGLKVTPYGTGPWSGDWMERIGSVTLYHDIQGHHTESPIPLADHKLDLFQEKINAFVDAVRQGQPAPIPGTEIVRNQAIIDGIVRSAQLGREVEIAIPDF